MNDIEELITIIEGNSPLFLVIERQIEDVDLDGLCYRVIVQDIETEKYYAIVYYDDFDFPDSCIKEVFPFEKIIIEYREK